MIAFFLLVLFFAGTADATTRYASPAGGGSAPCSNSATPCTTTVAIPLTVAGDTLIFQAGVYTSPITVSVSGVILQATPSTVTLRPGPGANPFALRITGNNVTVDGINCDGTLLDSGDPACFVIEGTGHTIQNLDIGSVQCGSGINQGESSLFRNIRVHDNGLSTANSSICPQEYAANVGSGNAEPRFYHGIYGGAGSTFDNVEFYNNGGYGLHFLGGSYSNITVKNSWIHGNGSGGGSAEVIFAQPGSNNIIYNTVLGPPAASGGPQALTFWSTNSKAYGLTIVGPYNIGINVYSGGLASSSELRNILISNVSIPIYDNGSTLSTTRSNNLCSSVATYCNLTGTIRFVNAGGLPLAADNYKLCGGIGTPTGCTAPSAGIDAGFSLASPYNVDKNGVTRPVGTFDIGAYEYATSTPTVVWTNDRGGSGTATLTPPNWTITGIPLGVGLNNITVTYTDATGVQTTDQRAVTYAPTFPGNTLAGAWAFESNGTDSSGQSPPNNAGLINGATYDVGKFGQALSLDGIDDYAQVNDSNSLDFTESFTFSAWIFLTSVPTDWSAVMVKNYMITLYAASSYCGSGTPLIYFRANGAAGPGYYACYATPLPAGPTAQWTHLAGTYDGAYLKLYINGALRTTTPATGYIEPSVLSLQIGASTQDGISGEFLNGRIDEARAYNWGIPLDTKINTTPGVACTQPMWIDNRDNPSVIGNMNCPIIAPVTPPTIKFPASASGLKVGAASGAIKLGQ